MEKVLKALKIGPISAIGGMVFDEEMNLLTNTTDLYFILKDINKAGIRVGRTDAGGRPTWTIKSPQSGVRNFTH